MKTGEAAIIWLPRPVFMYITFRILRNVRGLSWLSVKHYYDALNNISKRLRAKNFVRTDIYEIDSLEQLSQVRKILYADSDCMELNERGRRMYSADLNNYYRFASREEFQIIKDKICLMDVPVPSESVRVVEKNVWKRSDNCASTSNRVCMIYL